MLVVENLYLSHTNNHTVRSSRPVIESPPRMTSYRVGPSSLNGPRHVIRWPRLGQTKVSGGFRTNQCDGIVTAYDP